MDGKDRMSDVPKGSKNKDLQCCEECMRNHYNRNLECESNVHLNVNMHLEPFGHVQKIDSIYFERPPEHLSQDPCALPQSTVAVDTIGSFGEGEK